VKTVVREITGIKDCFAGKDEGKGVKEVRRTMSGSSLDSDPRCSSQRTARTFAGCGASRLGSPKGSSRRTIYSNDIYAILCTYGVEAARQTILREIAGVFNEYKIDVDARHLELITGYMVRPSAHTPFGQPTDGQQTFDGGYRPFYRKGIDALVAAAEGVVRDDGELLVRRGAARRL
jgi:hypothetical protein